MVRKASQVKSTPEQGLTITRVFDAPRELVWKAWTEPEHLKHWWGPKDFTAPIIKNDFSVGGKYLYCMRSPDGKDFWSTGVYREIVPMERIVATDSFADEKGNVVPASYYKMPGEFPLELLVTATFEDLGGKTKLTIQHAGMPGGQMGEMAHAGWDQSLDKLAAYLAEGRRAPAASSQNGNRLTVSTPSDREIVITRVFQAPRALVWRAFTDPELIAKWWGRGNKLVVERMEVERGGHWRFVEHAGGEAHGFEGRFREVTPPERLSQTFEWDGMPGHVSVNTAVFEDLGDGRTKLTATALFLTTEDRDGMMQSGMEQGMAQSYAALDRLLASLS